MDESRADALSTIADLFKQRADIFDDTLKIFEQMHSNINDAEYVISRVASSSRNIGMRLEDSLKYEREIPEEAATTSITLFGNVLDVLNASTSNKLNDLSTLLSYENEIHKNIKSLISTIM